MLRIIKIILLLLIFNLFSTQSINASELFQDDFNDNDISNWSVTRNIQFNNSSQPCMYGSAPTTWTAENGMIGIKISGPSCVTEIVPSNFTLPNNNNGYIYELQMQFTNTISADRNLLIKHLDSNNWYDFKFYDFGIQFQKVVGNYYRLEEASYQFQSNQTYDIKTVVNDNKIKLFINNQFIWEIEDSAPYFNGGTIGLQASVGSNPSSETWFDNIVVTEIVNNPSGDIDLDVPLFKQTDSIWGSDIYDTADKWYPSNPGIDRWGCAMTSAAMVFNYHGITKLPDEQPLNPGTLNTWLKSQKDGYLGKGNTNWFALARLSKVAKPVNPAFIHDALEFKRVNSENIVQLQEDLENNIPGILEVPGHFIVAKGISDSTFTINDPAYNRTSLSSYNNTFLGMRRFVPSNTDLSYIVIPFEGDVIVALRNEDGDEVGQIVTESISSYPDNTATASSTYLYFEKPSSGNYTIEVDSSENKEYKLQTLLYDKNGEVQMENYNGVVFANITKVYNLYFDKNDSKLSTSSPTHTLQILRSDIDYLYERGFITKSTVYERLIRNVEKAIALEGSTNQNDIRRLLNILEHELRIVKNTYVLEPAYSILREEINFLILYYQ